MISKTNLICAIGIALTGTASVLAQNTSVQNQQPASPKQPVNLTDVAELEFSPDLDRYDDWEAWPASWTSDFLVLVDQQGTPTYCEPVDLESITDLATRLCSDLVANAKVNILHGFSLGGREGIVAVSKQPLVIVPGLASNDKKEPSPFSIAIVEMGPSAFIDYEPVRDFEAVKTPGIGPKATESLPTYPSYSLRERHQGSAGIMLEIGSDGEITSCRPIESSGYARLDNAACRYALNDLEFEMGEEQIAQPAPHYYPLKITWKIPEK